MTREQIEQAAKEYAEECEEVGNIGEQIVAHLAFIAGVESRQAEIDELKTEIERYKQDVADGLKREKIAEKIISDKRREIDEIRKIAE